MVYADLIRPQTRIRSFMYGILLVTAGSLVVAVSALIQVRLPFTPVPITAQTLAVLLIGVLLGSRRGGFALLAYLGEGLAGLPVFAGGGFGLAHLLGPTGGYLIGFAAAAFLVGWLAERGWDRRPLAALGAMTLGNLVIYAIGASWLAWMVGPNQALALGVAPFVLGDVLKIGLGTALLPLGWLGLSRLGLPIH
ncbi:MAG: biotin transporter BioY [Anaerolineales bacterium]|jgi:biotin transport system substrate-specific component